MAPLNLYRFLFSALLLAGIALFTGQAWAILISNFSFESGPASGCPTAWLCADFTGGSYTPTTTQYPIGSNGLTGGKIVPDGTQAAFMQAGGSNSQRITETTTATFVAGQTYTLTAWAGWRADFATAGGGSAWGNSTLQLLAGPNSLTATVVATQLVSPDPTPGHWVQETLTYTATATDAGKFIGVGLLGATNGNRVQINWDDVTLTVPEPSTLLLLAMGFGSFALTRRKRKNPA